MPSITKCPMWFYYIHSGQRICGAVKEPIPIHCHIIQELRTQNQTSNSPNERTIRPSPAANQRVKRCSSTDLSSYPDTTRNMAETIEQKQKANYKSDWELSSDSTLYFSYLVKIQWRISCKWQRKSGNLSSASYRSSPQTDQPKQSLWKIIQSRILHHLRNDFIAGELKNACLARAWVVFIWQRMNHLVLQAGIIFSTSNRHLTVYVKEMYLNACCMCSTIIFLDSANHICSLFIYTVAIACAADVS